MCDVCLMSVCPSGCPNAPEPEEKPVFVCSGCSRDIMDGEYYWEIMGEQFCQECIDNARKTAEAVY